MTGRSAVRRPAQRRSHVARGSKRFVKRSRRRVARRILTGLAVVAGAAAVGGIVWLVGWSSATALDEVRISGVDGELAELVAASVDAPIGTPLIRVDTGQLSAAAEEVADVAEATAHRSWPTAVTIEVVPRQPEVSVSDGSAWWLVDAGGVLFGESAEQPEGVPVVEVPVGDSETDHDARVAAVAVLAGLPPGLAAQVISVSADTGASVVLTLANDATVMWGTAADGDRKAELLDALLVREAAHYDVSAPTNPAIGD